MSEIDFLLYDQTNTCPLTGDPCEKMAESSEYIKNTYDSPFRNSPFAVAAIASVAMNCSGNANECAVPNYADIDQTVQLFERELAEENPNAQIDERAVELSIKIKNPIDRALMWTELLPQALAEARSSDHNVRIVGLQELLRLRDVFHGHYGGFLDYPYSTTESKIFDMLCTTSETYMNLCQGEELLVHAAEDVADKFAKRYMKDFDDPLKSKIDEDARLWTKSVRRIVAEILQDKEAK